MSQTNDAENHRFKPEELGIRLDAATLRAINENRIVGAVVMVAHQGKLIYERALGMADREEKRPIAKNSIFLLSSITKPMMAALTMRLTEEGAFTLEDTVSRYLPDFRPKLADGSTPEIKIRHLLAHTAGFSYGFWEKDGKGIYHDTKISDGFDVAGLSLAENLKRLSSVPLYFEPGSAWNYSLAYDVLGAVIESETKKTIPELFEIYLAKGLCLSDTGFTVKDKSRLVTHYVDGKPEPIRMGSYASTPLPDVLGGGIVQYAPERIFNQDSYPSAGAGMAGSALDFMRFLLGLTQKESAFLSDNSRQKMFAPEVGSQAQTQGPGWGFGYGWAVLEDPSGTQTPQSVGTIQWGGVYGHSWFYDPIEDLAVLSFTNTAIEGLFGAYPQEVRNAVYGI